MPSNRAENLRHNMALLIPARRHVRIAAGRLRLPRPTPPRPDGYLSDEEYAAAFGLSLDDAIAERARDAHRQTEALIAALAHQERMRLWHGADWPRAVIVPI